MLVRAALVWIGGMLTLVPYGTYYLFFHAQRDEYALLIILLLFWIFGYWGVVGPILAAVKVRRVFRALESAQSSEELRKVLRSKDGEDAAVELIASENHIPRFLARRVYRLLLDGLAAQAQAGEAELGSQAGPPPRGRT